MKIPNVRWIYKYYRNIPKLMKHFQTFPMLFKSIIPSAKLHTGKKVNASNWR